MGSDPRRDSIECIAHVSIILFVAHKQERQWVGVKVGRVPGSVVPILIHGIFLPNSHRSMLDRDVEFHKTR